MNELNLYRVLAKFDYFSWGFDAWIHEGDLGEVLTTDEVLERENLKKT